MHSKENAALLTAQYSAAVFLLYYFVQSDHLAARSWRISLLQPFNVRVKKRLSGVSAVVIAYRKTNCIVNQIDGLFSSFERNSAST